MMGPHRRYSYPGRGLGVILLSETLIRSFGKRSETRIRWRRRASEAGLTPKNNDDLAMIRSGVVDGSLTDGNSE